jgi:hypothetical protein
MLFALTGASLLLGSVFLAEIWGDGDSADSEYIEGALIFVAVALVAAVAGAWTLRSR